MDDVGRVRTDYDIRSGYKRIFIPGAGGTSTYFAANERVSEGHQQIIACWLTSRSTPTRSGTQPIIRDRLRRTTPLHWYLSCMGHIIYYNDSLLASSEHPLALNPVRAVRCVRKGTTARRIRKCEEWIVHSRRLEELGLHCVPRMEWGDSCRYRHTFFAKTSEHLQWGD